MEMDKQINGGSTDMNTHRIISEASQTSLTKMKVSLFTNPTHSPKPSYASGTTSIGLQVTNLGVIFTLSLQPTNKSPTDPSNPSLANSVDFTT